MAHSAKASPALDLRTTVARFGRDGRKLIDQAIASVDERLEEVGEAVLLRLHAATRKQVAALERRVAALERHNLELEQRLSELLPGGSQD